MLKLKQSVSFDATSSYVDYNYEGIEFRDNDGNEVSVKMSPVAMDSLAKSIAERQERYRKNSLEKFSKVENQSE